MIVSFTYFAVEHGIEPATGDKIKADGCNCEELEFFLGEIETERGEGEVSEERDGENVGGAAIGSNVVLPHDGPDLFGGLGEEAS